ncbi:hypothetical protein [Bacillus cereus]|uniref:hypothetical protein n=1 Tax=Bacillus cereus TaxID=1396 RepID=UPI003012BFC9
MIVCMNEYDDSRMETLIHMSSYELNKEDIKELQGFRWDVLTVYSLMYPEQWEIVCENLLVEPEIDKARIAKRLEIDWIMYAEEIDKAMEFAEIFLEHEKNREI